MKVFCTFFLFLLTFCSVNAQEKNPPLIVGITIQQMRYDALSRYAKSFGADGFMRLLSEGAECRNAFYDYMLTKPSAGFATIYTGANPSGHGIVSDAWYDRNGKKIVRSVYVSGKISPDNLLGTTLGDEIKLSNFKRSRVYSVSYNCQGAVLPSGKLSDGAFWFDENTGNFISSEYYMKSLPVWAENFNTQKLAAKYLEKGWFAKKTQSEYLASLPDNSIYENGIFGQSTFPYLLKKMNGTKTDFKILRYTPYADELTKDFVLNLIENMDLGKDEFTDLLTVNFSSAGSVSDVFGIRSMELEDVYIRLDNAIAAILRALDRKLGRANYVVFLTSDCGSSDTPAFLQDMGLKASTVNVTHYMTLLNAYLRALYGDETWVEKYFGRQIYLNHQAIERHKLSIKEVQDMASQFLLGIDGIAEAVPSSALLNNSSLTGVWKLSGGSFYRKRSGDIIISLEPHFTETGEDVFDGDFSVSAQNSPYSYDTHVPLIFYGLDIKNVKVNRKVSITDITPTLSTVLKILSPDYATGEPVAEIF